MSAWCAACREVLGLLDRDRADQDRLAVRVPLGDVVDHRVVLRLLGAVDEVPIPTNLPMVRGDQPDLVYRTEEAKYDAVVDDIAERNAKGQPILVGTVSVEKSEHLSEQAAQARHPALGAERQGPRRRGEDRRDGRAQGRGHGRHQHGRPRHRHHARRLGGVPRRRRSCASRASSPTGETAEEYEAAWPGTVERIKAQVAAEHDEVKDARRPLRRRHRAARVAPHRQPAARSFRPSGRPGRVAVLPVARGRADAAVQVRLGRPDPPGPQDPRRRPDREQAGHRRDRQRPGPDRGAELRLPQERPQVRRRHGPPAPRDLRRAPQGARGRRPRGADRQLHRRRRRGLRRPAPPRASPRSGTSTRCRPSSSSCGRCRSTSTRWPTRSAGSRGSTATT